MFLVVRVIPRSSLNKIVGKMANGSIKIKLTAPPADGKANEALVELLSEEFNKPKSKIRIIKGFTSRSKVIEIGD